MRIAVIYICFPVHIDKYFRIPCLFGEYIGNDEIAFTTLAHAVNDIVIDIFQVHLNTDFLCIRLGSFSKQRKFRTAGIEYEIQFQILSILIHETITVTIFPSRFRQQFLSAFHIIFIRISLHQFIEAEIQRWRKLRAARCKGIFQKYLCISFTIQ